MLKSLLQANTCVFRLSYYTFNLSKFCLVRFKPTHTVYFLSPVSPADGLSCLFFRRGRVGRGLTASTPYPRRPRGVHRFCRASATRLVCPVILLDRCDALTEAVSRPRSAAVRLAPGGTTGGARWHQVEEEGSWLTWLSRNRPRCLPLGHPHLTSSASGPRPREARPSEGSPV